MNFSEIGYIKVVAALTAIMIAGAAADRSWFALWMAIVGAPAANVTCVIGGIVVSLWDRRPDEDIPLGWRVCVMLMVSFVSIVVSAVAIFAIGVSGC